MPAKRKQKNARLTPYRPIAPLPADKPLCPPSIPLPPAGKFRNIDGQMVLDFGEDERAEDEQ